MNKIELFEFEVPNFRLIKFRIRRRINTFISTILPKCLRIYYTKNIYRLINKRNLNIKNPKTLSEKIQWLKFNENNPLKTLCTDKLAVKDFVKAKIPSLKIAKVYAIAKRFEDIDFSMLPNTFMVKTNHACRNSKILRNKELITSKEYNQFKKFFNQSVKENYFYYNFYEPQYKNIEPKIFIEEFLTTKNKNFFVEYLVWCFNGEIGFIDVVFPEPENKKYLFSNGYYDEKWQKLSFKFPSMDAPDINRPKNLEKIIEYAKILSKDFNFVRVDFMDIDGELYFGELTFTPHTGFLNFEPVKYDFLYGEKLKI